jgi:hypothetical protein
MMQNVRYPNAHEYEVPRCFSGSAFDDAQAALSEVEWAVCRA